MRRAWAMGLGMFMLIAPLRHQQLPMSGAGPGAVSAGFVVTPTITAASCSQTDVQTALTAATASGSVVAIPAGTCHWTTLVSWSAPANSVLEGSGTNTARGGSQQTIIIDDYVNTSKLLDITNVVGSFRITQLDFKGGTGSGKENGLIVLNGTSLATHIDHTYWNFQTYSDSNNDSKGVRFGGWHAGVYENNLVYMPVIAESVFFTETDYNTTGTNNIGDQAWAAATGFGTSDFVFIEDNTFYGKSGHGGSGFFESGVSDCNNAGKFVIRYNTIYQAGTGQTHPSGGSGAARGCRAHELYGNSVSPLPDFDPIVDIPPLTFSWMSSGTALVWGNTTQGAFKEFIHIDSMRKDNSTYGEANQPDGFGYCGGQFLTATVNTSGTAVTATSFPNAPGGWKLTDGSGPAGHASDYQLTNGAAININSVNYTVFSLTDASHLTLTSSAGTQTGVNSYVYSPWDGNTDATYGYPCLDDVGRGIGDLLNGASFPNRLNVTQGNIVAWPRQASEPIYEWNNTFTSVPGWGNDSSTHILLQTGGVGVGSRLVINQDYYSDVMSASCAQGGGACSSGVGSGTRAQRPANCTKGAAWWSTDQGGNWNTTNGSSNDGTLDLCTATNTWTNGWYVPYTYPHPLR